MNFVFISPHFPHTYWQFCQRLSQNGGIYYWGHDVAHDWAWWRKQIVYFMQHMLSDEGVEYVI